MWYCFKRCREENRMDVFQEKLATIRRFENNDHVDPRQWFGGLVDSDPVIPPELAAALTMLIQQAYEKHRSSPQGYQRFLVSMFGRVECELPKNWTEPLIRMLLPIGVFIEDEASCPAVNHPQMWGYGRDDQGNCKKLTVGN